MFSRFDRGKIRFVSSTYVHLEKPRILNGPLDTNMHKSKHFFPHISRFQSFAQCQLMFIKICIVLHWTGRCGHGSPCEQLCYELHDGMYECDCTDGYELNKNGYSCQGKLTKKTIENIDTV